LAIECDGDRYHAVEKLQEDMDRQAILERMGWIFTRVRATEFFRNPNRALKSLFEKLEALEIPRAKANGAAVIGRKVSTDLIERVVRHADELRTSWISRESSAARSQAVTQLS
jgi:hypothetical protein